MQGLRRILGPFLVLAAIGCSLVVSSCGEDEKTITVTVHDTLTMFIPDTNRVYVQIERLGNPLVSEVMFAKRNHGFHNATGPATDVANFTDDMAGFVTMVAGRSPSVATVLTSVLLPDMMIVEPSKAGNTGGWLSWVDPLGNGYGGRMLDDDVVDAGLSALFGALLDTANVTPGLATDNVDGNDEFFSSTFPYLAAPH
jgi:hypothetical protein